MVTGSSHHVLQCLTFLGEWVKVRQAKFKKIKLNFKKNRNSSLKIARIEEMLNFCNTVMYFLT